jgi:hypothetical protein
MVVENIQGMRNENSGTKLGSVGLDVDLEHILRVAFIRQGRFDSIRFIFQNVSFCKLNLEYALPTKSLLTVESH